MFGGGSVFGSSTSGFGTTNTQPAVGTQPTTNIFGQPTTQQPQQTTALGFGSLTQQTTQPAFGTGSLGVNPLGTNTLGTNLLGTNPLGGTLGSNPLGGTNTLGTGLGTLGSNPLGTTNLLGGSGLGTNPLGTSSFGLGSAFGTGSIFQTNQQQFQQQQQIQQHSQQQTFETNYLFNPKLFNDQRDQILSQFNKLQAYWGTGKAYYAINSQPVELDQNQIMHRFKAIGFSEIKSNDEANANCFGILIKTEVNDINQINTHNLQYETNLKNMLGMKFTVKIESVNVLPDKKALLKISILDTSNNSKIPAKQLVAHFSQVNLKAQLNNAFLNRFLEIVPLHAPSKQEFDEYLNVLPPGIDELLWNQAKLENPDPNRFIPVPLIGFAAIHERFLLQQEETTKQRNRLKNMSEEIEKLERNVAIMKVKLEECKHKNVILSNRALSVMVWHEVRRKRGLPVQAEEDQLRAKLEVIISEINAPTKFKGCLNEIICRIRQMQSQQKVADTFNLEESKLKQIKEYLEQEQEAIRHLIGIVKGLQKNQ